MIDLINYVDISSLFSIDFNIFDISINSDEEEEKWMGWLKEFGDDLLQKKIWWIPDFVVDMIRSWIDLAVIIVFFALLVVFLLNLPFLILIWKLFRTLVPKKKKKNSSGISN